MLLGSVSAMRTTLKNNSRKKKEKKHFIKTGVHADTNKLIKKKATPEQIALIRQKIKKEKKRNIVIGLIFFLIFIPLFILLLNFLSIL